MLPHVSLCVWCVPWLGEEEGRHEGGGGNTVGVRVCVCMCVSSTRRTGKRNRTNRERATETPESLVFHPRLIIY